MKNNFRRLEITCPSCKFCIQRESSEDIYFYCGLDKEIDDNLIQLYSNAYFHNVQLDLYLEIYKKLSEHEVDIDTVCDDFEGETNVLS